MVDYRVQICLRFESGFGSADEVFEAFESVHLVRVAKFCRLETAAEHPNRLVVGLQGHRKWMSILAAMGEGEAGGIGKAAWGSVHYFAYQGE